MQFEYTDPQTELERLLGGFRHINAFGAIEAGDDDRFRQFLALAQPPPRTTIYLDSTGGEVEPAIGIGREIRSGWFSTAIGKYLLKFPGRLEAIVKESICPASA